MEIDTAAFFDPHTGRKRGLGSSAVATLLLVAALKALEAGGSTQIDPSRIDPDEVIRTAITAHRAAHGGRGSGYDIATSGIGGAIRFTGGNDPAWESVETVQQWRAAGISLFTATERAPVSSSRAVERFDHHIPRETQRESALLSANNTIVDTMIAAPDYRALFCALKNAAHHGVELGEHIGVTAALPFVASHTDDGWVAKASGAGNERSVFLVNAGHRRPLPTGAHELIFANEGLRCEFLNL